jgi:hypothetical protein
MVVRLVVVAWRSHAHAASRLENNGSNDLVGPPPCAPARLVPSPRYFSSSVNPALSVTW